MLKELYCQGRLTPDPLDIYVVVGTSSGCDSSTSWPISLRFLERGFGNLITVGMDQDLGAFIVQ